MGRKVLQFITVAVLAVTASACTSLLGDFDNKGSGGNGTSSSSSSSSSGTGGSTSSSSSSSSGSSSSSSSGSMPTFKIGGTVAGLATGDSVVLQDNGADDLSVTVDGNFSFPTSLASGAGYAVTVATQPSSPAQTCVVANGAGTVANVDVTNVAVTCSTNSYTVGGTVSGLAAGESVVLRDNGGDDLTVNADGSFTFATAVASGQPYAATVFGNPTSPVKQTCVVANGSGTVTNANVTSVQVTCTTDKFTVGGTLAGLTSGNSVVLQDNGGDNLPLSANGAFTFATSLASGAGFAVTVLTQPNAPPENCVVSGGTGTVGAGNVTSVTVTCTVLGFCVGKSAGTVCRAAAGQCDVAEVCDGTSADCPPDVFVPSSTVCRNSTGVCDVAEYCTGSSAACPADGFQPTTTVCNPAAGACDIAEYCTGSSATCPPNAFLPSSTVCRAAMPGGCDVAESCTGTSATCPADVVAPSGTMCRASAGVCDVAETCNGSSNACPADAVRAAGFSCRASAGVCDVAETCDGTSKACPADGLAAAGTTCRAAAGACDVAETCTGGSATCPADAVAPAGTVCRAAVAGGCDVAETCNGSSNACPADVFAAAGVTCRAANGPCDVAETCTGASSACPADGFRAPSFICRASTGPCDAAETCTGSSAACPADGFAPSGTACNGVPGPCKIQDTCNGTGTCIGNGYQPSTYVCSASANFNCTYAANCTGSSGTCPAPGHAPVNTYCNTTTYSNGGNDYTDTWGCDSTGGCTVLLSSVLSCPILYSWDGTGFAFESDMYTSGTLGLKLGTKYRKPDPNDAYVLRNTLVGNNGQLDLRLVEELEETDYLDEARLFAVDVPSDRAVVAWANNIPGAAIALNQRLVSIGQAHQPLVSAVRLDTGVDVTASLSGTDGDVVVLTDDMELPTWHTIEVDLGDLSGASIIKLIVDGRSRYPKTQAGMDYRALQDPNGWQTKLEVLDAMGNWTLVPRTTATLVRPKEFPRAMAANITNAFLTNNYKMRFSWVNKTVLDSIWIDTTPNVPLTITEAPLLAATVDYHGFSFLTGGDLPVYSYAQPGPPGWPLAPGSYTAYGDVTALLGTVDDMFVIFGSGDEVAMGFVEPAPPATGMARFYTFASVGYYKQSNLTNGGATPYTVAPLPFGAMSNFPYDPAVEQYPTDPAHQAYQSTWNTRVAP